MWTVVRQVCFQAKKTSLSGPVNVFVFSLFHAQKVFPKCFLPLPLDAVLRQQALFLLARRRAGRAARHRTVCWSRGRPSWQQHWDGNVLFRSTSSTTMSARMVSAYRSRVGSNQETPSPHRSLRRRSPTSTLRPPQPLHSSKTNRAAAVRSAARSTSTPSCATGSSTCWTSGRHNDDGARSSACAKSSACAPGCSTGSTRTLPTAGNGAHQQKHRSAGRLCCHPQT